MKETKENHRGWAKENVLIDTAQINCRNKLLYDHRL